MFDQNKYLTVSVAGFAGQDEFTLMQSLPQTGHLDQRNDLSLNQAAADDLVPDTVLSDPD